MQAVPGASDADVKAAMDANAEILKAIDEESRLALLKSTTQELGVQLRAFQVAESITGRQLANLQPAIDRTTEQGPAVGGSDAPLDTFGALAGVQTQQGLDMDTQRVNREHGEFYGMGLVRTETMLEDVTVTKAGKVFCRRVLNTMRR